MNDTRMSVTCCPTNRLAAQGVEYAQTGRFVSTYVTEGPEGKNAKRSVLFIPDIFGFHPHSVRMADCIAAAGFRVYFSDYFDGKPWTDVATIGQGDEWPAFFKLITSPEMLGKVRGEAAKIKAMDGGLAPLCIGFCWGASLALQLAASSDDLIACAAMPHPSLLTPELAEACRVPVGLFPSQDDTAMLDIKGKLEEKKMLKKYIYCDDVPHGFTGARHDAKDAAHVKRWDEVLAATVELFKSIE